MRKCIHRKKEEEKEIVKEAIFTCLQKTKKRWLVWKYKIGIHGMGEERKGEDFEKHCVSVPSATRPGRPVGLGAGCCWNQRGGVPSTTTTGALCLQSTLGSHCDSSCLRFPLINQLPIRDSGWPTTSQPLQIRIHLSSRRNPELSSAKKEKKRKRTSREEEAKSVQSQSIPIARRLVPEDESIEVGRGSTRPTVLKARASERASDCEERSADPGDPIRPVPFTGRSPRSRVTIARGAGRARRVRVVGC